MKEFMLVVSIWIYNGEEYDYSGNQLVLQALFYPRECLHIANNWEVHAENDLYRFQVNCWNNRTRQPLTLDDIQFGQQPDFIL